MLQRKAIQMLNQANYYETSNEFIKLNTLKFDYLVDFRTALIMCKAHHNLLPHCIQKLFETRECDYELWEICTFKETDGRTKIDV